MKFEDLDITSITTGIATVAIVIGVIVLAVVGRPIPEVLILAMTTVLGFLFGRGTSAPATARHTRALEANTAATQQVAETLESAPIAAALSASTAVTAADVAVRAGGQ